MTALEILRAQAAVFDNGFAPPGWCEVQRNDTIDEEGVEALASDSEAARRVAELGGMPGTSAMFAPGSDLMVLLDVLDEEDETFPTRLDAAELLLAGEDHLPQWVVIVPVEAALRCGLITESGAEAARSRWT